MIYASANEDTTPSLVAFLKVLTIEEKSLAAFSTLYAASFFAQECYCLLKTVLGLSRYC